MDARKFHMNHQNKVSNRMIRDALASVLSENKRLEEELRNVKADLEYAEDSCVTLEQERDEFEADRDEYYDNWKHCEYGIEEAHEMIGTLDIQVMELEDEKDEYHNNWQLSEEALEDAKKKIEELEEKLKEVTKEKGD